MSQVLISQYLNNLSDLKKLGDHRESVVREAFKDLLKGWGKAHDLIFVPEYAITTPAKDRRYVDGALLHELRMPFGYWEAKDEKDDLDAEIAAKFSRGYPSDNIIFEDSKQAVLIQNRNEVIRCAVDDVEKLEKLLNLFFGYQRTEIQEFNRAVDQFKTDLPAVLEALRAMIEKAHKERPAFREAARVFLEHAHEAINPNLTEADVREMLIQHILTDDIFSKVFGEDDFHHKNNVAKALFALEETFFTGDLKKKTLRGLDTYYAAINSAAARISSHSEKQAFLKVIYENFYKVYNPKAADRLGVVYTPNEIVRFMIESADWLCEKHFGRNLIDPQVEILDPATGTGTFICELLEHFRGQPKKLKHKYQEELHANEVAILPYYVANLNIEATYQAITGEYLEFPSLCFVDTLDNVEGLRKYKGHQHGLFGSVSEENVERIRRQNLRKISVVIGNPPYNANQLNENENNKNREYPDIDKRIKETYIEASTAQKTKLYDMYARFFRWASDRLAENGVVAFITNRSFVEKQTFDGFRNVLAKEFSEVWIVDLGGDVRANPKLSGTRHNVFGIQTGVAISFLVKRQKQHGCRIFYARRPELETAEDKLAFLGGATLAGLKTEEVEPDRSNNWVDLTQNDFDSLLPLAAKATKAARKASQEKALFRLFSLGVSTNRDEWLYDLDPHVLGEKAQRLVKQFEAQNSKSGDFDLSMKWSETLKRRAGSGMREPFDSERIVQTAYRPFFLTWLYRSELFIDRPGAIDAMFPVGASNRAICFSGAGARASYMSLAVERPADLHFGASVDGYQQVSRYVFEESDRRADNITDWGLDQFKKHYTPGREKAKRKVTKDAIFHYVYGVLHDPVYREKYALNLKRGLDPISWTPKERWIRCEVWTSKQVRNGRAGGFLTSSRPGRFAWSSTSPGLSGAWHANSI